MKAARGLYRRERIYCRAATRLGEMAGIGSKTRFALMCLPFPESQATI